MLNERHSRILKILSSDDKTSVSSLSEKLRVSSVTVRQDLNYLEGEGLLRRVHGGAVLADADDLSSRLGVNFDKKLRIARKVASFISEGDTILIESGSANALVARELSGAGSLTVITTNIFIARQLRNNRKINVILPGGLYQHDSESLVGGITRQCIGNFNIDKAFLGIDGYTPETGFTLKDLLRAEVTRHIIKNAHDTYIVTDSSKFGKNGLTRICWPGEIGHVVTDSGLGKAYLEEFEKSGVDLVIA